MDLPRLPDHHRIVDLAGVRIALVADSPARREALDGHLAPVPDSCGDAQLTIGFVAEPLAVPLRPADTVDYAVECWLEGDRVHLRHATGLSAVVDGTVLVVGGESTEPDVAFRHLFQYGVTHLLAPLDAWVLHAGAIGRTGRAALLLGSTGSGKSTLAYAALSAGWALLADDLVVVSTAGTALRVTGIPKQAAVPAELLPEGGHHNGQIDARNRRPMPAEVIDVSTHELAGLVRVSHGTGRGQLNEVPAAEALEDVLWSFPARTTPTLARGAFELAARLSRLPAVELQHAADPDIRVRRAGELLEEAWASSLLKADSPRDADQ